ncbi:prepilin-type N-terminal cleavage/methylation domain-containing protein [Pseudomonas aeruginosa]
MQRSKGFTLIEVAIAVALVSFGTIIAFQEKLSRLEQAQAAESGNWLLAYNNAAREWVSANIGASSGTRTGSAWLKPTTCPGGLSAVAYLPCNFPDGTAANPIPGGDLTLSTSITTTGAAPDYITTATTTTSPYQVGAGKIRSDLSGLAALVASSGSQTSDPKAGGIDGAIKSQVSTGIITMVASNNGSTDPWLRTDGSNTMNNVLRFNPSKVNTMREIQGVSRISNLAAISMTLGTSGGAAAGYSLVVDANKQTLGSLLLQNNSNLSYAMDVAKGNIVAAAGDIQAAGDVIANQGVTAQAFIDSNNGSFKVDPNGTSVMNVTQANGYVMSPIVYDAANGAYQIDPDQTSRMNQVVANSDFTNRSNITFNGLVQAIGGAVTETAATEDAGCSPNGLTSHDPAGVVMTCMNGRWRKPMQFGWNWFNINRDYGLVADYYDPTEHGYYYATRNGTITTNLGTWNFCSLRTSRTPKTFQGGCHLRRQGTDWVVDSYMETNKSGEVLLCHYTCAN